MNIIDEFVFMKEAIIEAKKAALLGEWPIGAVITHNNQIIAKAHNMVQTYANPCAHAEILAAEQARKIIYAQYEDKFLHNCKLFVTLEPCSMCMEYLKTMRISQVIYGAHSGKTQEQTPIIIDCIYKQECEQLLKDFASELRIKR